MLSAYQRSRLLLSTAMIISLALFWIAGRWFLVPLLPDQAGALVLQPAALVGFAVAGVMIVLCVTVGSVIAGTVQHDAGLMSATFGLAALSMRAGPMRENLFVAAGPRVYLGLALEAIILFWLVGLGWLTLRLLSRWGLARAEDHATGSSDEHDEPLDQRFLATLTHVIIMTMLMMILCQSDQKAQVLASVGISAMLASMGAHQFVATSPSAWFWSGPLIVALLGYVGTYFSPSGWNIGVARGVFAPLARPQPLDYASWGVAGAIMGYWISRRWHRARHAADDAPAHAG